MRVVTPILFNHESERRTTEYVSRKISMAAARIKNGDQTNIRLGDISGRIDWGYAPEFVAAMIKLALNSHYDDYLIGSATLTSVEQFAEYSFECLGLDFHHHLVVDERFIRPTRNKPLRACIDKVHDAIGFQPQIYGKILAERLTNIDYQSVSNSI